MIYGYIYLIRNKVNNKIYIGQTINSFDKRYKGGLYNATSNIHLKNSIDKYGIENFEINKQFDVAYSKEELDGLEDMYIKMYKTYINDYGYNKKFGGANGKLNQEALNKISGENHYNYGKKLSEETKQKIRENHADNKGEKCYWYGKKLSEEHRANLSKNHADVKGANNGHAKKVRCITTNKIFDTVTEAQLFYEIKSASNISSCCRGNRKTAGKLKDGTKLKWEYVE